MAKSKGGPPSELPMTQRIIKVIQRTVNYISADCDSMSNREMRDVCLDYLELHGGDDEATQVFFSFEPKIRNEFLRRALPE